MGEAGPRRGRSAELWQIGSQSGLKYSPQRTEPTRLTSLRSPRLPWKSSLPPGQLWLHTAALAVLGAHSFPFLSRFLPMVASRVEASSGTYLQPWVKRSFQECTCRTFFGG